MQGSSNSTTISYNENEEQLLFNFRVSHEHGGAASYVQKQARNKGELGEFFGDSLTLLSFSIVE